MTAKHAKTWTAMQPLWFLLSSILPLFIFASAPARAVAADFRAAQFIGFSNFSSFDKTNADSTGEILFTSPEIPVDIHFNQLIVSWNADMPGSASLKIEARAIYPGHSTKYY